MDARTPLPTLEVGSLLAGRYRLGALLGAGGMASVHRATDEVLRRDVAVKVLAHASEDPVARQRERAEIDMLATLRHRSLVTIFDAATVPLAHGMSTIIVMELVDGPTLTRRRARGSIADADLVRLVQDMAEALVVVHARGIVHRDVKPSNILLDPSPLAGREFDARLADFGIASLEGSERLTASGTVLGTAAYLSPEQAEGGRVGPAGDVYSLGLVVLEAITGAREFPGPMLEALTARMLRDPVVPASVHPRWAALLTSMTARRPEDRPTAEAILDTAAILAADEVPTLVDAESGATATLPMPTSATAPLAPAATGGRRPRRRILLGAILASAAAVAVAIGAVASQPPASPEAPAEVAETPVQSDEAAPSPTTVADPDPAPTPATVVEPASTTPAAPAPSVVPVVPTDGNSGNGNGNGNGDGDENGNSGNGNGNSGNG